MLAGRCPVCGKPVYATSRMGYGPFRVKCENGIWIEAISAEVFHGIEVVAHTPEEAVAAWGALQAKVLGAHDIDFDLVNTPGGATEP